jgi:hypothetical protein
MAPKKGQDTLLSTLDHLIVRDDMVLESDDTLVHPIFENIIPREGGKVRRKLGHACGVRLV